VKEPDPNLAKIVDRLREIPDLPPPASLLPRVMDAVLGRELPWWVRLRRWARSPLPVTLTPLRLAPAALLLLAGIAIATGLVLQASPPSGSERSNRDGIPVVFHLQFSGARSIKVIGTFNRWQGEGFEMHWDGQRGLWVLAARLPAGRHEYAFLVDGQRVLPDPGASLYQEDGFGNRNAVLILGNGHGQRI
jgi:hypothetical protein